MSERTWVEMILSSTSLPGTVGPLTWGRWRWPGPLAPGPERSDRSSSLLSFSVSSFYFPIPEKKEPCFQGEAERKASKLFGK